MKPSLLALAVATVATFVGGYIIGSIWGIKAVQPAVIGTLVLVALLPWLTSMKRRPVKQ